MNPGLRLSIKKDLFSNTFWKLEEIQKRSGSHRNDQFEKLEIL